jgi:flagellar assembly factor FliW
MPMLIDSSRFGQVEIAEETVVEFPDGLIGLGGSRYALLVTDAESPFVWLHSLEDPTIALPLTNPHHFFQGFSVELTEDDAERLGYDEKSESVDVYVTVRAAPAPEDCTANLKAPILIRSGTAHQVINQAASATLRARLFGETDPAQAKQAC